MTEKKPFEPKITLANDLLTGRVVVLTETGDWSEERDEAAVARDPAAAAELQKLAEAAMADNRVVGAELIPVDADGNGFLARVNRERIRLTGPTVAFKATETKASAFKATEL